MKMNSIILIIVFVIPFFISPMNAFTQDTSKTTEITEKNTDEDPFYLYVMKGKVYDALSKKPLEGAMVVLTGSDGSKTELKTNKKGVYEFGEKPEKGKRYVLPDRNYTLTVTAEGYETSHQDENTSDAEESTTFELDFAMQRKK